MLDRDEILRIVDEAYGARQRSEKAALHTYFAENATFRMVGQSDLSGLQGGSMPAREAIGGLIDLFTFHRMERKRIVVDGQTVVIHWKVEASVKGREGTFETELCDILTVTDQGKVESVEEFADTAQLARILASRTS